MKSALVVIDCQADMFEPSMALHDAEPLLARINRLIDAARAARAPVVFVRNCGLPGDPDEPGIPGFELDARLHLERGDRVVDKQQADAFQEGELAHDLLEAGIGRVVLVGVQSEYCVDASARGGVALGFEICLVSDGHSTISGETQTAAQIIEATNRELEALVDLVPADSVRFD
ncbi:MAG: isochorismatase family protein [Candidatus Eisenbacteria bacterium]